jgi:hypothetical protein
MTPSGKDSQRGGIRRRLDRRHRLCGPARVWLLCTCLLGALSAVSSAGGGVALEVSGLPPGAEPQLRAALAAQLELATGGDLRIDEPSFDWFWRARPDSLYLRVRFEHYYAGRHRRTLIPLLAARYAFRLDARGSVAFFTGGRDSLVATIPFEFDWERPIVYQFLGAAPDAASAQPRAPEWHRLEQEALRALTVDLARKLKRMHERAGTP